MKKRTDDPATLEIMASGKFLEMVRDGRWEFVRRHARGAVFVLAVTPERELILVEQHRVPVGGRTIELPAGIYGDEDSAEGETPEDCAIRELEEEAGYRGGSARRLLSGPVAPGLTSEILYLVQVEGLRRVNNGGGVGGEDIIVHRVPLDRIGAWLGARRAEGLMVEPRIYAALYFLPE